ncbi:MAG: hypothetical protein JXJ04_11100 [Spirochaetales bacterium]|nr:hypothetical protein [Spirochaetales bacterium]
MLVFLLKKTFFDMWDNLLSIIMMNAGTIILFVLLLLIPASIQIPEVYFIFYIMAGLVVINFYLGAVYRYTLDLADFKSGGFKLFFTYLVQSWKESLFSSAIMFIGFAILFYGIPYYFLSGTLLYTIFGTIVVWVWFTLFMSGLYFFPACFRLNKKILQTIKTCFVFFLDNIAFSCFMLFIGLILFPISLFLVFLFPGPATVILWINDCFKIRLYKYDYLDAHPMADKKKIPWDELLREDRERVGPRTVRGMIFPWKS